MAKNILAFLIIILAVVIIGARINFKKLVIQQPHNIPIPNENIISGSFDKSKIKTDEEWKKILTPEQYHILREQGTEIPFTGALDHETRSGTYYSVGCDTPVFRSEQKYDSGTGWPSFWAPINNSALVLREDTSLGDSRVEVLDQCGGHLGHVFYDGPQPTSKRYCMNSAALKFVPDKNQ